MAKQSARNAQKERMTLPRALKIFVAQPSVWLMGLGFVSAWIVRIGLGDWSLWDAAIIVAYLAAWPFVEWLIHVFILHMKPLRVGSRSIDLHLAKKHRAHHQDPDDRTHIFIPLRSLLLFLPLPYLVAWWLLPTPALMWTTLAGLFTMGLIYEWCHFLIHTNYRAKTSLYKRLWRHHRLHHFKHERHWFGVSTTLGDKVFGTAPDFREIDTSSNCRTLGIPRPTEE